MRYSHIYKMLIRAGHSAMRAAEIVLDAKRGQPRARQWIFTIYHMR